jgi:Spy/CpxP family protein refolding chaperone
MVISMSGRLAISLVLAAMLAPAAFSQNASNPTGSKPAEKAVIKPGIDTSMGRHPYGYHLKRILIKINARPPQQEKIGAIVESHRPKLEPLREEYRQKSEEFLTLICTGKPAEVVMSRQNELNQLHNEIINEYCLMRLEIRRLLDANQWELFQDYSRQQGWTAGSK